MPLDAFYWAARVLQWREQYVDAKPEMVFPHLRVWESGNPVRPRLGWDRPLQLLVVN